MTPGTGILQEPVEHYSRIGSDPAKPLRQQLEEGLVIPGGCVILGFFNLKRERAVQMLFPTRADAERHVERLIADRVVRRRDGRVCIRSVEEALA